MRVAVKELKTQAQVAEELGLPQKDNDLVRIFAHLRKEHGLAHTSQDGAPHYVLSQVRAALRSHKECEVDLAKIVVDPELGRSKSPEELRKAAKADGLITEAEVGKRAEPRLTGFQSGVARVRALENVGLGSQRVIGKTTFYDPAEVEWAIDRWTEFNQGRAAELRERSKAQKPAPKATTTQELRKLCQDTGGVTSTDIGVRYAVANMSNFLTYLNIRRLRKLDKQYGRNIYDPNVIDALAGQDPIAPWPEYVIVVPCITLRAFMEQKLGPRRTGPRQPSGFERKVNGGAVKLYRDEQPGVYRLADLEVLWQITQAS